MTFSLAGRCARTGRLGVVVSSSSPAVAARCAWARAGTGAVLSQNVTDPSLGPAILGELAGGRPAQAAVDAAASRTRHSAYRQLAAVDAAGRTGVWSGAGTLGPHATATGPDCVAAGNMLGDTEVPAAMVRAFTSQPGRDLGDRLMAALRDGLAAGGEAGQVRSAGLLIVAEVSWPVTDLRVDWDEDPVTELTGLWDIWRPQEADYLLRALDPGSAPGY